MGFKKPTTIYRLKFEGMPEYEGLEIDVKSVSAGKILELARLTDDVKSDSKDIKDVQELVKLLADGIVRWNLEDENDAPIPVTAEELADLEVSFLLKIVMAWTKAVAGIADDLKKDLSSGQQFPEGSMMKDASLASLMNS